jgi:hypothetical protein
MRCAAIVCSAALLAASSSASAQTVEATPVPAAPEARRWDHGGQFGLRAGMGMGYSFVIRYHDGAGPDPCDAANNKFCTGASPLMLDTALGFGVTRGLELDARFRLGVTESFDGSRPMQVGIGLRTMGDGSGRLKFVLGAAMYFDVTGDRPRAGGDFDFILRAEEGLQYEVNRWLGVYGHFGESFGILRNFSCVVDATVGLQLRAP